MDSLKWYAVYVRSRFEKKVHMQLVQKQIESYLPLVEEIRVWSDRKKKVHEPLFRGYVFVKFDLRERLKVLRTEGLVRLVGNQDRPSPIHDDEIEWIRRVLGDPTLAKDLRREELPVPGKRVEIVAGPLRGVRGTISQIRGRARFVIEVEAIARAFSVEVPPEFLRETH